MKTLIAAALMAVTLTGCIAVPFHGYGPRAHGGYEYSAPPPPASHHPRHHGHR